MGKNMGKNIVILNGSPRKNGNTSALVQKFTQGARQAGHTVSEFFLSDMKINGCKGCFGGHSSRPCPCVQKDDMDRIYPAIRTCDVVVLASPLYYWNFSGQLRTAMDRLFALEENDGNLLRGHDRACALLMAAEGHGFEDVLTYYQHLMEHLHWTDLGHVLAAAIWMRETLPESRNWSKPMPWEIPLHNKQPQGRSRSLRPSDCRKTYITKRVVRPPPDQSAKSRDLRVAFCTSQGRGAPLVRWPDGHTFFAFLHRTCPARERSMGAEALRQPLAKTRKSGLSHFFDMHKAGAHSVRPSRFIFSETPAILLFSRENPSIPDRTGPARPFHPWSRCPLSWADWGQTQRPCPPFPGRKPL